MNGTFEARIRWLIGDRPVNAWFARLQIADGTRARMLKEGGIPPTYDALARIMRTENASLSWLLGAKIAPFLRSTTSRDEETARLLDLHLADEPWTVAFITDGMTTAWVLHQPAAIEHERGTIHYRATAIIAGPSGDATAALLARYGYATLPHVQQIQPAAMHALTSGYVGTYHLFGDERTRGLIDSSTARHGLSLHEALSGNARHVAESAALYQVMPQPAREIVDAWDTLPADRRRALELVVTGLVTPPGDLFDALPHAAGATPEPEQ